MRFPTTPRLLVVIFPILLLLGITLTQNSGSAQTPTDSTDKMPLTIIPIVSLQPGETKELLLSTHCTVGATRGGGFGLAEMRDGARMEGQTAGHDGASYTRDGVAITVPDWNAAEEFARSEPYASLRAQGIQAFVVTISASDEAEPGLLEMHLVDATCSGHCDTDFRVLVVAP